MPDVETPDSDDASDPYDAENERLTKLLERHAAVLGEHFESVRIFGVVNRGDGCYGRITRGEGNYFSQYGSVRDWLIEQEQATRNHADE